MNTKKKQIAKSTNEKPQALLKETKEEQVKEMMDKLNKMRQDRMAKCDAAKKQLVEMLEITKAKYQTATGTAEALRVIRFVYGEDAPDALSMANTMAWTLAGHVDRMTKKAEDTEPQYMDGLLDGFYDADFAFEPDEGDEFAWRLVEQMMLIDLCRNVGGSVEDMTSFWNRATEEINETEKALAELKKD